MNQDSFVVQKCFSDDGTIIHVLGVFDGHGVLGEVAALIAGETIKKLCAKKTLLNG